MDMRNTSRSVILTLDKEITERTVVEDGIPSMLCCVRRVLLIKYPRKVSAEKRRHRDANGVLFLF